MINIEYFKGSNTLDFEKALLGADSSFCFKEWKLAGNLSDRNNWETRCDILISHGDPEIIVQNEMKICLEKQLDQMMNIQQNRRVTVIFLSSGPLSKNSRQSESVLNGSQQKLNIFYVRNTIGAGLGLPPSQINDMNIKLASERWAQFLKAIVDKDAIEEFFKQEFISEHARVLKEIVCGLQTPFLLSLSILCQGYLSAYALKMGKQEGIRNEAEVKVTKALERIGWTDLCQDDSKRFIIDILQAKSLSEKLWENVMQTGGDYWKPLSEVNDFKKKFSEEWCALKSVAQPEDLNWLVSAIEPKTDNAKNNIDQPGKVAQAYLDIVDAMEARR